MLKLYVLLKKVLMTVFFSGGRIMKIRRGPLKNYRYVVKSDTGFSSLLGRWEKESQKMYLNSIFKDFIVFDLGANYGIHAMLYSKLVGEGGKVYAFEPLPGNVKDLETHIALNNIKNIKIVEEAITDKKGHVEFKVAKHRGQGSLIGLGKQTGELLRVNANTLDEFCYANQTFPDFVKIDVEGAEGHALKGFSRAVKESYPYFAIDLHTPECDRMVGEFFAEHGYEVYRINDPGAQRMRKRDTLLEKVKYLDRPWPDLEGIWGVIWAVHPSRKAKVEAFINENL